MATKKNPQEEQQEQLQDQQEQQAPAMTEAEKLAEKDREIAALKEKLKAQEKLKEDRKRPDAERVAEALEKAAKEKKDPWQIYISILVPRRPAKEDPWYWVSVNNRTAQIPANDRYQEMRLPFAAVLMDSLSAERGAQDFQDSVEVWDPITNPHR